MHTLKWIEPADTEKNIELNDPTVLGFRVIMLSQLDVEEHTQRENNRSSILTCLTDAQMEITK